MIFIRDRKYIVSFKKYDDPKEISIDDLIDVPLVNIIIPAWNEDDTFEKCLISITELKYPKIKVITNAGGNLKTLNIANSFKKYQNFTVLEQKPGGKLKAINECLNLVSEGISYLVDADVNFTDEILLRMIHPITNLGENVVIGNIRPLVIQEKKDLVKFLFINNDVHFRLRFSRYGKPSISGANTTLSYEVIKSIKQFSVDKIYAVETSQGDDILKEGFNIYRLTHFNARMYTKFPEKIKPWIKQKIRWNENTILFLYQNNKKGLLKFLILFITSLYLLIFPFIAIIHLSFAFFGLYLLLIFYLKKVRRIIFSKLCYKNYSNKFGFLFYIKVLIYIYIEALVYVFIFLEMILLGGRKLKKRKNL